MEDFWHPRVLLTSEGKVEQEPETDYCIFESDADAQCESVIFTSPVSLYSYPNL